MVERISQSMIKDMREYLTGEACGIVVRERWVVGRLLDSQTDAMELGCYFEYILTEALPKNGIKPEPKFMASVVKKNGGKTTGLGIPDMYDEYRKAHERKDEVLRIWGDMGFEIAVDKKGKPMSGIRVVKGRCEGTIDVVLVATREIKFTNGITLKKGDKITVDIKYSGLLDDKWSKHGWQWTPEQTKYHGTQAKHYKLLLPNEFFFFVVSSGKTFDVGFFHMNISPEAIDSHISEGNDMYEKLKIHEKLGFEPRPALKRCNECPLNKSCEFKHTYPHPKTIEITDQRYGTQI